jgi:hypothetical protein
MEKWLEREKRIILHAGGQSRRLPAYAATGKALAPAPVFRWARGQRLSQNLLSLAMPLYEEILDMVPESFHTLIASGDVYIRRTVPLQDIPAWADVVCYGLWADPHMAARHGVFLSRRDRTDVLDFMLQKPSPEELGRLSATHLFLMDTGIWLLSDRAVKCMMKSSPSGRGRKCEVYDLYAGFGLSLGANPQVRDSEIGALAVAILPLTGGEFYHYGTGRELISSYLAVQNLVDDQRIIMHRAVKPHPAMFVQNARVDVKLTGQNSYLWIENSHIGVRWHLSREHILTGIPLNNWSLTLPEGVCIDVAPVGDSAFAARPYGIDDTFRGSTGLTGTSFMGKPLLQWACERGIRLPKCSDVQDAQLFPVCETMDRLEIALRWMTDDCENLEGKAVWNEAVKMSASELLLHTNVRLLSFGALATNHERSVFYQLDLADAAREFVACRIPMPPPLSSHMPLMKRVHDSMFRSEVARPVAKMVMSKGVLRSFARV